MHGETGMSSSEEEEEARSIMSTVFEALGLASVRCVAESCMGTCPSSAEDQDAMSSMSTTLEASGPITVWRVLEGVMKTCLDSAEGGNARSIASALPEAQGPGSVKRVAESCVEACAASAGEKEAARFIVSTMAGCRRAILSCHPSWVKSEAEGGLEFASCGVAPGWDPMLDDSST
jgi:hypothetical protein